MRHDILYWASTWMYGSSLISRTLPSKIMQAGWWTVHSWGLYWDPPLKCFCRSCVLFELHISLHMHFTSWKTWEWIFVANAKLNLLWLKCMNIISHSFVKEMRMLMIKRHGSSCLCIFFIMPMPHCRMAMATDAFLKMQNCRKDVGWYATRMFVRTSWCVALVCMCMYGKCDYPSLLYRGWPG